MKKKIEKVCKNCRKWFPIVLWILFGFVSLIHPIITLIFLIANAFLLIVSFLAIDDFCSHWRKR